MNVIFIIGLPASGKTRLAYDIRTDEYLIDDPTTETLRLPDDSCDLIITDPNLCNADILASAEDMISKKYAPDVLTFQRIYFANNPEQCLYNAVNREDNETKKVDSMIKQMSKIYNPPETARPVFVSSNRG